MSITRYWVAAISKDHAQLGVRDSFIQVCHGKQGPLSRMKKGDYLLVYSSKNTMEARDKLQAFTAVGQVEDNEIYQFQMTGNFKPFRRKISFYPCEAVSILPLINDLEFIVNKTSWGYPFRFGFFEIKLNDFNFITSKMLQFEKAR